MADNETPVYNPPAEFSANAHVKSIDEYRAMYDRSISNPEGFWAEQAEQRITWLEKWHTVRQYDYHKAEIGWYLGGKLNACYNCVDRHVEAGRGDNTALIWEGKRPDREQVLHVRGASGRSAEGRERAQEAGYRQG